MSLTLFISNRVTRQFALVLANLAANAVAWAQPVHVEIRVEPPAQFQTTDLISVPLSGPGQLVFGVDPSSLSVTEDQVVRYVLVGQRPQGAVNVVFEGVNCKTGQTRVLARWNEASGWKPTVSEWRALLEERGTRPAAALARNGLCEGATANTPVSRMVRSLRNGPTDR